jgi:methylmalonyl-CoA mutase N-terminal domain/subunit
VLRSAETREAAATGYFFKDLMTGKTKNTTVETASGIPLGPVYTEAESLHGYSRHLGDPGEYPYARGIRRGGYRERLWTMRQYAGFGSATEANERFRYLLANGQTGLSVAFDLPTQIGLDSDHSLAAGEVGRIGVAIDTIRDMEALFDGIPLARVSSSMTINATAPILVAMYQVVGERQGAAPSALSGTVQNDLLKEYIARGTYIYPPRQSLRLVTDVMEYASRVMPRWNPISISGYHIREAGATAVQELAFTLGNAIAYVDSAIRRGMAFDEFAPRLTFFFGVHNDFLEEVAKFRAARRMWARIARERYRSENPRSMTLRFHAQTCGSTLTAQFPDANAVRVALQAAAAVLGGAQSLHTNSRDEALAIPHDRAVRLALRTQQILGYESGLASTADPVGGSFAIESLTDRLEAEAQSSLEHIEALGGMPSAIESGFVQREIQDAAWAYQRAVETSQKIVVGVNRYVSDDQPAVSLHRTDQTLEPRQVAGLAQVRRRRDPGAIRRALDALGAAARSDENLMRPIVDCVRGEASVGEISDVLRSVFGTYSEAVTV